MLYNEMNTHCVGIDKYSNIQNKILHLFMPYQKEYECSLNFYIMDTRLASLSIGVVFYLLSSV